MDRNQIRNAASAMQWAAADLIDSLNVNDPHKDHRYQRGLGWTQTALAQLGYELTPIAGKAETERSV